MSAFVCGPDHFIALAVFAAHKHSGSWRVDPRYVKGLHIDPNFAKCGPENLCPSELGAIYANVLYAENVRSVSARYPEDTFDSLPGPIEKPEQIEVNYRHFDHINWVLKPVAILKLCDSLEYQSCETDDWEQTVAHTLLQAIRRAAIRCLPGYDDAPWDYYADEKKAA